MQLLMDEIWSLVEQGELVQAREKSEQLVGEIQQQIETTEKGNKELLTRLAHACHVAGFTVNLSVRNSHALVAHSYFHQMYAASRQLPDASLRALALCCRGECFRRYGNGKTALRYLGVAYRSSANQAIHGYSALLLARLSSSLGETEQFQQLMLEAEQIARSLEEPLQSSLHGHYSLGTVFLEYGTHYSKAGEESRALACFAQAEKSLPDTPYWQTELGAARGVLLVHSGDLEGGMPHVKSAAKLAKEQGNHLLLERFATLHLFLGRKCIDYSEANCELGEALYGSF